MQKPLCICICIHEIIYIYIQITYQITYPIYPCPKLRVTTEVMLRNPWGQKEWTGDYSDSSDRWGIWLGLQVGVFGHWKKLGIFRGLLWFRSSMISMIRKCGKNWILSTQEILLSKITEIWLNVINSLLIFNWIRLDLNPPLVEKIHHHDRSVLLMHGKLQGFGHLGNWTWISMKKLNNLWTYQWISCNPGALIHNDSQ